jgi:hypothetical protein
VLQVGHIFVVSYRLPLILRILQVLLYVPLFHVLVEINQLDELLMLLFGGNHAIEFLAIHLIELHLDH